jgi:hypothetical protein
MKAILIIIICFVSLFASAGVYDTLGFKVNVPKISKADDKIVGIHITFDTINKKLAPKISQNNIARIPGESISIDKLVVQMTDYSLFGNTAYYISVSCGKKRLQKKLTGKLVVL